MPALKMTPKLRERFCAVLAEGVTVDTACRAVGIHRSAAYRLRDSHPAFASAWEDAVERGTDRLEDIALELATVGEAEPVWYQGQIVGQRHRRSENLLMALLLALLRARRPQKFRDNARVEVDNGQLAAFADAVRGIGSAAPPFGDAAVGV